MCSGLHNPKTYLVLFLFCFASDLLPDLFDGSSFDSEPLDVIKDVSWSVSKVLESDRFPSGAPEEERGGGRITSDMMADIHIMLV